MNNWSFFQLLHGRCDEKTGALMTTAVLAQRIGSSRAHVCEVLSNKPGHGFRTRQRLFPHLTTEEVRTLGWGQEYGRWQRSQKKRQAWLRSVGAEEIQTDFGLMTFIQFPTFDRSTGNNVPIGGNEANRLDKTCKKTGGAA